MNFKIHSAIYGEGDNWIDVKNILDMQITPNGINIVANNHLFGDPSQFKLKQLKVEYSLDGETKNKIINEKENFTVIVNNVSKQKQLFSIFS